MKGILVTVLLIGVLAGGAWWFANQRNARMEAERVVAEQAALQALRDERVGLFGEAALADDIEWSETGMGIQHLQAGTGPRPLAGGYVTFSYRVRLKDGTEVQHTEKPTEARIGQMIPGVSAGLMKMGRGGKALLLIPPKLGYGKSGYGPIPPDAGLLFEVELFDR